MPTYAEQLGNFTANLKFGDIPPETVRNAKLHMLDALGICLVCSTLPYARIVMDIAREEGGLPESTVIAFGDKLSVRRAAFVNGCLAHGYNFDDSHILSIMHPSALILPTVFPMAEKAALDGRAILTAIIAGLEIATRLGLTAPGIVYRGIDPNPACGVFAAAAAAGKVFRMDAEQIASAMGICGVMASGSMEWETDGSWPWAIQTGWAAQGGILGADMARRGFLGPHTILEGKAGFYQAFATEGNYNLEEVTKGLGQVWQTDLISYKSYPACTGAQAYIDCALDLKKEYQIDPAEIESFEVKVGLGIGIRLCDPPEVKVTPPNIDSAQTSIPYTVSAALVEGKVGVREVSEGKLKDPDILNLARKVKVTVDTAYDEGGALRGWVGVTLKDGRTLEKETNAFKGSPTNPLTEAEVVQKFMDNATIVLKEEKAKEIVARMTDLESVSNIARVLDICKV